MLLVERGATFGYGNLVVDMRGLVIMRELGVPVCLDATHSVQLPAAAATRPAASGSSWRRWRAAAAVGIDALFTEIHEDPPVARSDGPNSLDFDMADRLLTDVLAVRRALGQP